MAYSSQLLRQYKIVAPVHHMVPNMKEGSFVASYVASYVLDAVILSAVLHNSQLRTDKTKFSCEPGRYRTLTWLTINHETPVHMIPVLSNVL